MSQTIRTTMRPDVEITVSDVEYAGLVRLGLVYGVAVPGPQDPSDGEVAAYINEPGSAVATALKAAVGSQQQTARNALFATDSPSTLTTWKLALGNRATAQAALELRGDSNTEGQGASAFGNRWASLLPQFLRAKYPTAALGLRGGAGYISPASSGTTSFTWPLSSGGAGAAGFISYGPKRVDRMITTQTATFTVFGTSIDITYLAGDSADMQVVVDGGAPTSFATSGPGGPTDGKTQRVTFGARGSHTVSLSRAAGGAHATSPLYWTGVIVYDGDEAAGIIAHEAGHYGWNSGTGSSGWLGDTTYWPTAAASLSPDLIVLTLGTNDVELGITSAQYKSNLQAMIAADRAAHTAASKPAPSFLLHMMPARIGYETQWATYVTAAQQIAATDPGNIAVFDQGPLLNGASGLFQSSIDPHLTDWGHRAVAANLATAL